MEDLNKYMEKSISSLSTIRSMVQDITDKKEEYLALDKVKILTTSELDDTRAMTTAYHDVIERNDLIIDFIIDIKNTIFKIKLIKDKIDRNSQAGIQQIKQIDYFISLLQPIQDIMSDERSKMDRVVRYYEKIFSYYKDF